MALSRRPCGAIHYLCASGVPSRVSLMLFYFPLAFSFVHNLFMSRTPICRLLLPLPPRDRHFSSFLPPASQCSICQGFFRLCILFHLPRLTSVVSVFLFRLFLFRLRSGCLFSSRLFPSFVSPAFNPHHLFLSLRHFRVRLAFVFFFTISVVSSSLPLTDRCVSGILVFFI